MTTLTTSANEHWNPALAWAFTMERVTGIEPALSAWESVPDSLLCNLTCGKAYP
jgi:hypothetical protein